MRTTTVRSSTEPVSRYENGCMAPDMGSVFMPVDRCTRENSCLQVS